MDIIWSCHVVYHDWLGDNKYSIHNGHIRGSRTFLEACYQHLSYWFEFFFSYMFSVQDHLQGFTRLDILLKQSILNFLTNKTPM